MTGYESLVPMLELPDPDDRHVLAVAARAKATTIVTYNLADVPDGYLGTYGVRARHPDGFIVGRVDADPDLACLAIANQRGSLVTPRVSVEELLATFAQQRLPRTGERPRPLGHLL